MVAMKGIKVNHITMALALQVGVPATSWDKNSHNYKFDSLDSTGLRILIKLTIPEIDKLCVEFIV